jgi:hypothetical protein
MANFEHNVETRRINMLYLYFDFVIQLYDHILHTTNRLYTKLHY